MGTARRRQKLAVVETPIRLRFGDGEEAGFAKATDLTLETYLDESVESIFCFNHFHRLTREQRHRFADDAWRVLKFGGEWMVVGPHWSSAAAIADPLAEWPPLDAGSFFVYNAKWRETQKIDLGLQCDFGGLDQSQNVMISYGLQLGQDFSLRNEEYQAHARTHLINTVTALHVTLKKEKR